jgi:hypothetical protein
MPARTSSHVAGLCIPCGQLSVGGPSLADRTLRRFHQLCAWDSRHAADIDSLLRARGLSSFFDRRSLQPGLPWVRGLEKALNAGQAAIILIGPHGLGNTQQYERDLAIIRQVMRSAISNRAGDISGG